MPRIIAGVAGGVRLAVPAGKRTRPTADRVKEALFSALDADSGIAGARVLDLYAGSGGLGLEAASRGAGRVVLVESDLSVLTVLRANVGAVGLPGVQVEPFDVDSWLARTVPDPFDIVLVDPPYSLDVTPVLRRIVAGDVLARSGRVVVERSSRDLSFAWPDGIQAVRDRRYGETTLCYGRRA